MSTGEVGISGIPHRRWRERHDGPHMTTHPGGSVADLLVPSLVPAESEGVNGTAPPAELVVLDTSALISDP